MYGINGDGQKYFPTAGSSRTPARFSADAAFIDLRFGHALGRLGVACQVGGVRRDSAVGLRAVEFCWRWCNYAGDLRLAGHIAAREGGAR